MTADEFRQLALALPEAIESAHMGHADFRVRNKIFATLPDKSWGMVALTPEQQDDFGEAHPTMFDPVPGGWGKKGSTRVHLEAADPVIVGQALLAAWRNKAPKALKA